MLLILDSDTGEEETDEGFFVDVTEVQIKKNPAIRTLSVSGPPIRAQKHNHIHGKLLHNNYLPLSGNVLHNRKQVLRNNPSKIYFKLQHNEYFS